MLCGQVVVLARVGSHVEQAKVLHTLIFRGFTGLVLDGTRQLIMCLVYVLPWWWVPTSLHGRVDAAELEHFPVTHDEAVPVEKVRIGVFVALQEDLVPDVLALFEGCKYILSVPKLERRLARGDVLL